MSAAAVHDLRGIAERPAPLIGSDVDLRDFTGMMIDIPRLMRSKSWLAAKRRPELGFYNMNLWMRAWNEVPAGSIENDDDVLADAAMCSYETWLTVKSELLRSWVLCSDDRWYNPTLCEKALEAWGKRVTYRERSAAGHKARWDKQRGKHASSIPGAMREGEGEGDSSPSGLSPKAALFGRGGEMLRVMTVRTERSVASFIGVMLATMKEDAEFVLGQIEAAHVLFQKRDPDLGEVTGWLSTRIRAEAEARGYPVPQKLAGKVTTQRRPNAETQRVDDLVQIMIEGQTPPAPPPEWGAPRTVIDGEAS